MKHLSQAVSERLSNLTDELQLVISRIEGISHRMAVLVKEVTIKTKTAKSGSKRSENKVAIIKKDVA